MKLSTLCYLIKDNQILLAQKKRGFGVGKWNGVGGKVEAGESIEQSAIREIKEEIGLDVLETDLINMGTLTFHSENAELNWKTKIYIIKTWQGEPEEVEEMRPKWFMFADIPYDEMWSDDIHWFPYMLKGKKIEGRFHFNFDGSNIEKFEIEEIT